MDQLFKVLSENIHDVDAIILANIASSAQAPAPQDAPQDTLMTDEEMPLAIINDLYNIGLLVVRYMNECDRRESKYLSKYHYMWYMHDMKSVIYKIPKCIPIRPYNYIEVGDHNIVKQQLIQRKRNCDEYEYCELPSYFKVGTKIEDVDSNNEPMTQVLYDIKTYLYWIRVHKILTGLNVHEYDCLKAIYKKYEWKSTSIRFYIRSGMYIGHRRWSVKSEERIKNYLWSLRTDRDAVCDF
jgi:hypothetical protein